MLTKGPIFGERSKQPLLGFRSDAVPTSDPSRDPEETSALLCLERDTCGSGVIRTAVLAHLTVRQGEYTRKIAL